jgi:hypothetical protein
MFVEIKSTLHFVNQGGIMRFMTILVALLFGLSMSALPLSAQGRGNGQAKKTAAGQSAPKVTSAGPKGDASKSSVKSTAVKPAHDVKHGAKTQSHPAKKTNAPTTTVAAGTTPTTVVTLTTPTTHSVKNAKLEARLQGMLPPGTTVQAAADGFRNWGQFVAAVHVSNNLGLPFDQLKSLMTGIPVPLPGTTPGLMLTATTAPMSLGQAIQTLKGTVTPTPATLPGTRPGSTLATTTSTNSTAPLSDARIRAEVKKAEDAANADLRRTRESS